MAVVPGLSQRLVREITLIQNSPGRENLLVLYPGDGEWIHTTTNTWFEFLHNLSLEIPDILRSGWVHEWPTYRLIPEDFKERWFIILAGKNQWDMKHNLTVWTQFNEIARTIFREEMRQLRKTWASGGEKPSWMIGRVWLDLVDMFEEFGPDDVGY